MKSKLISLLLIVLALFAERPFAAPLGPAFTYQGRLNDGPNPANAIYDLRFTIYDAPLGGSTVAGPITNSPVAMTNGLFTVTLDFGVGVFGGEARWLEIGVRTNGSPADFVPLTLRQALTATPYAHYAALAGIASSAGTATTATSVSAGAVDSVALAAGAVDASKIAAGAVTTTNLSPEVLANTFWRLDGNAGTTPGAHLLGTTGNQPLEFQVNGSRTLRLEPTTNAPNVIAGWSANYVAPGVVGAVIAGGGNPAFPSSNQVLASWSTIGGGVGNQISALRSVIAGGLGNTIEGGAMAAGIGGGVRNLIQSNAVYAHIGGGLQNTIQTNALYSTIGGGYTNTIGFAARFATIPGGLSNAANAEYTLAAGRRAQANHPGAFVWADGTDANFASTSSNQFLIRAGGGVGVGTNNPQSALHVAGTVTADAFSGSGAGLTGISLSALPAGVVTNQQTDVTLQGFFNATNGLVIESRTSDPPSPAVGQVWLRTDL
jgi:hypothetical protein